MAQAPYFWRPEQLGFGWREPIVDLAREEGGRLRDKLPLSKQTAALLLIDLLRDFIFENGNLSVQGGVAATRNIIDFIYGNAKEIDEIIILRDFHPAGFHITLSPWWVHKEGHSPRAFTDISQEDVCKGIWTPRFYPNWSKAYLKALADTDQPQLKIWWEHCVGGTPGANFPAELDEAITWLRATRDLKITTLFKGVNPKTDQFGFLPCVPVPEDPMQNYYESILRYTVGMKSKGKKVYAAGLAEDICLHVTLNQMITAAKGEQLDNVYLLQDCTSPVLEKDRGKYFERYQAAGIHIIKSTD